tara:strand:+ start:1004 stop:1201 length:198 start_codon:yes stop_codon:yes gene_type:complete
MFDIKYPKPKIQPIKKNLPLPTCKFEIIKKNKKGNVKKFNIKKLYGGKLNELIIPSINGIIKKNN